MEQKLDIQVNGDSKEIIVRQGDALKLKEPVQIIIAGTIDAPSRFLEAKKTSFHPIDGQ